MRVSGGGLRCMSRHYVVAEWFGVLLEYFLNRVNFCFIFEYGGCGLF